MEKDFRMAPISSSRFFLFSFLIIFTSCSWVTSKRSLFGDDESVKADSTPTTVPKQQYDELLLKYDTLMKERQGENIKSNGEVEGTSSAANLVEDLQSAKLKNELSETVEIFGKESAPVGPYGHDQKVGDATIEEQLKEIKLAESEVLASNLDSAMSRLKALEKSPVPQVRARAKMLLGDVLLKQNEYDLAMQIYEDVIRKEAHSGVVLKVLGKLILCCEKLKQDQKKEQYFSMLHDFFEEEK